MTQELITAISDITEEECTSLKSIFAADDIPFIANQHDPDKKHRSIYFEIQVEKKDIERARPIIARHKAKEFLNSQKCPRCGHLAHRKVKKDKLWVKIYFLGTTLFQCRRCKNIFGV